MDYDRNAKTASSLGTVGKVVAPAAADLNPLPKAVVCLTAGNITVVPVGNADNGTIAFVGVPAGFVPPFRVRRVTAATSTVYTIED